MTTGSSTSPSSDPTLEERFNRRLAELFESARSFVPFLSVRNLPTLGPEDGLPLTRHLLASPGVTQSFEELWAANCTQFTPEWLATQPQYAPLFTHREIDIARGRLGLELLYADEQPGLDEAEAKLRRRLLDLCDTAKRELRYDARLFRTLVEQRGGAEAVRAVLAEPALLGALAEYAEQGRRDLSVEACALEPSAAVLFSAEELALARSRVPQVWPR